MGLILWIDENKFATALIEKAFKKAGLDFYTIDSVKDFAYLVEDLNPEIIFLDSNTFLKAKDDFIKQYNASSKMQKTKFIINEELSELAFLETVIAIIPKPYNPFELPEKFQKICKLN